LGIDYNDIEKKSGFERLFEKLSDLLVDKFTYLDDDNLINFCYQNGKCKRTSINVSENYMKVMLRSDWRRLVNASHVLPTLVVDSLRNEFNIPNEKNNQLFNIFLTDYFFPKLYKKYFTPLIDDSTISESMESDDRKYKLSKNDINKLMKDYEYMGYDREYAVEELIDLVSYLNNLKSPLILYRIICSNSEEEINLSKVGSHYSLNKNNLKNNHYRRGSIAGDCRGEKVFLLTVSAEKLMVDVMETLSNNILYPHEEEITLKNKGVGVKVINVEEL
jgi:hypothetical protein